MSLAWVTWQLIQAIWVWIASIALFVVMVIHVWLEWLANRELKAAQHLKPSRPFDWATDLPRDTAEYQGLSIEANTAEHLTEEVPLIRPEWIKS